MFDPLLRPEQVAKLLNVELATVWRMAREGPLRSAVVRIGHPRTGRIRIRRDLLEAWIAGSGGNRESHQPAGAA